MKIEIKYCDNTVAVDFTEDDIETAVKQFKGMLTLCGWHHETVEQYFVNDDVEDLPDDAAEYKSKYEESLKIIKHGKTDNLRLYNERNKALEDISSLNTKLEAATIATVQKEKKCATCDHMRTNNNIIIFCDDCDENYSNWKAI